MSTTSNTWLSYAKIGGNDAYVLNGAVPAGVLNKDVFGATFIKSQNQWVFPAFRPVHRKVALDLKAVCAREKLNFGLDPTARAHLRAMDAKLNGGSAVAVNLGTGTGRSVREVVAAARRVTGRDVPTVERPRRPGDPPELVAAVSRAATVLGWRAAHSSVDEILSSAWQWHQTHPQGYRGG